MKKDKKLYNIIFPIWFVWLMPPLIIFALIGNFLIDSAVILISFKIFKSASKTGISNKSLYKKSILKVWGFGFLADIIGTIPLLGLSIFESILPVKIPYEITSAVAYDPFSNIWSFIIVLGAVLIAGVFIFLFNYFITFKKTIDDKKLRLRFALTLAIVTLPWTFMIPTKFLY